jgi:hypothetical protein
MWGQAYPIWEIGLEKLVVQLLERGGKMRDLPGCEVQFIDGATIDDHECTLIQIMFPEEKPEHDFYLAQIFLDDERQVPLRYAAYLWPETAEAKPPVIEEYTYQDVKLNVGLTDADFDPDNSEYHFP